MMVRPQAQASRPQASSFKPQGQPAELRSTQWGGHGVSLRDDTATTTVSKWMQQHERADELILNELHTLDFSINQFFLASRVGLRL